MRLSALARWFEIGIRSVGNDAGLWRTMLPSASSHHFGDEV